LAALSAGAELSAGAVAGLEESDELVEVAPAGFEVEAAEDFDSAEALAPDAPSPQARARSDATAARTTGLLGAEG
jgi:hypothetical protein